MEPVLLTSEYLTLCRPTLQHSGRVRPVSELPKCVHGVLPAVIEMKVLPVQQRTALHRARRGCQACCPFLLRRGGGNGHGPAPVLTNQRTGNCSVCCCGWCQPQFCGGHAEANQGTVWTPDWVFLVCMSWVFFPCLSDTYSCTLFFFPRGLWQQICVWWTWRGRIFYIHHWWP